MACGNSCTLCRNTSAFGWQRPLPCRVPPSIGVIKLRPCRLVLREPHALLVWATQARSEIYVGKLRQQLCFLPGLPWLQMGSWALPEQPVQALSTSIRRVARLLWMVHLSFQEGFDEVGRLLKCCMPSRLLFGIQLQARHAELAVQTSCSCQQRLIKHVSSYLLETPQTL